MKNDNTELTKAFQGNLISEATDSPISEVSEVNIDLPQLLNTLPDPSLVLITQGRPPLHAVSLRALMVDLNDPSLMTPGAIAFGDMAFEQSAFPLDLLDFSYSLTIPELNKNTSDNKVFSQAMKNHQNTHSNDTAACVHQYVSSSFGLKHSDIVT